MGLLILFRPAAPTGTLFTITLTASSANVAGEIKQVNSVRVGTGPNVASVIKQDNATRAAASPNIGKAVKQVSATKFAASPNIAVLAKRAGLIRSARVIERSRAGQAGRRGALRCQRQHGVRDQAGERDSIGCVAQRRAGDEVDEHHATCHLAQHRRSDQAGAEDVRGGIGEPSERSGGQDETDHARRRIVELGSSDQGSTSYARGGRRERIIAGPVYIGHSRCGQPERRPTHHLEGAVLHVGRCQRVVGGSNHAHGHHAHRRQFGFSWSSSPGR
jgi:hypothetical protein